LKISIAHLVANLRSSAKLFWGQFKVYWRQWNIGGKTNDNKHKDIS